MTGIGATAGAAIYSIRKTAQENRTSAVHIDMCRCLIGTVKILRQTLVLLGGVADKAIYTRLPTDEIIENAYTRFWRELEKLHQEYTLLVSQQLLLIPELLFRKLQVVVEKFNYAKNLAALVKPDERNIYPDTTELRQAVNEAGRHYREFVSKCRTYIGPNKLKALSDSEFLELKIGHESQVK